MPRTKKYPEWVLSQRPPGHSVKEKNGKYYLYKTTSIYRPGKNPTSKSEYVGVITKDGVLFSKRKKVDVVTAPTVVEYGFSYVLKELAYDRFARSFDTDKKAFSTFQLVIARHSERSFLIHGHTLAGAGELHVNVSCKEKAVEKLIGMPITDLYPLKSIFLVTGPGYSVLSEIEPEARQLLDRLGVNIHA